MRVARRNVPGVTYHLISRFVDRDWFFREEEERANYLRLLGIAMGNSDWRCLAYALMSSHIHLAVIAGREPLSHWILSVHSTFASWMNRRRGRNGPLFARGPKDRAAPPARVGSVIAYIHNNPVRAHVVPRANASAWTSHRAYADLAPAPPWLCVEEGRRLAGVTDPDAFDRWVDMTPGDSLEPPLGRIRAAAQLRGPIEVATPTMNTPVTTPLIVRPTGFVRIDPRLVVDISVAACGLRIEDVRSRRRHPQIVVARRVAVHAATAFGIAGVDVAAGLGLSQSAVSQIASAGIDDRFRAMYESVVARIELVTGHDACK